MTNPHYRYWPQQGSLLSAIAVYPSDRQYFFRQFEQWATEMKLPLYLWNAGYTELQQIDNQKIIPTSQTVEKNILSTICNLNSDGIFLVEGIVQNIDSQRDLQLRNAYDRLIQTPSQTFIVLFDEVLDIPMSLYPLIPQFEKPFPSPTELEDLIHQFCQQNPIFIDADPLPLLQACTGLPEGEISIVLNRLIGKFNRGQRAEGSANSGESSAVLGSPQVEQLANPKGLGGFRRSRSVSEGVGGSSQERGQRVVELEGDLNCSIRSTAGKEFQIQRTSNPYESTSSLNEVRDLDNRNNLEEKTFCHLPSAVCLQGRSPANSLEELADAVLEYAKQKLAGKGVRILPPPDVPQAAGLDLLDQDIDKIASLFDPRASSWKLRNPNGGLLWGLPGTGKSLVAKMIAQRIHAKMIAVDFNQLVGSTISESLQNLKQVLNLADHSGNVVLFFDEFEKNFVGWESGGSGGAMAKMTGELLSWLQDHTTPVFLLATINRLNLLPAELVRRFKYVWFLGNPHNGAMYEIFNIHLRKYCPNLRFTDSQWLILLDEYRGCSPDEIGKAVERTLETNFHQAVSHAQAQGQAFNPRKFLPQISLEDLLTERQNFTPASANKAISDQLYAIKQDADFARPTSGRDTSRYARIHRGMFEQSGSHKQVECATKLNRQPSEYEVI